MISRYVFSVLCVLVTLNCVLSVAIYRDTDVIKKSHRGDRQLNDLPLYDDDDSMSRYESQWESAEWPQDLHRQIRGRDNSYESEERPYNWFYYNKFITNGRFNHLYNGPHLDDRAGIGHSGNRPPKILPRPAPSFGGSHKKDST